MEYIYSTEYLAGKEVWLLLILKEKSLNLHTISSQVATLHGENNPLIPNREIDDAAVDLDLESCCLDGVKCSCLKKKNPMKF